MADRLRLAIGIDGTARIAALNPPLTLRPLDARQHGDAVPPSRAGAGGVSCYTQPLSVSRYCYRWGQAHKNHVQLRPVAASRSHVCARTSPR